MDRKVTIVAICEFQGTDLVSVLKDVEYGGYVVGFEVGARDEDTKVSYFRSAFLLAERNILIFQCELV